MKHPKVAEHIVGLAMLHEQLSNQRPMVDKLYKVKHGSTVTVDWSL